MKPLFNTPRNDAPTTAYYIGGGRIVRAAPMMCPCGRCLHASDFEAVDGNIRAICQRCHRDTLAIERQP